MSLFTAILGLKCPRCERGNLYKSSLIQFKGVLNMHDNCPVCGQKYDLEPGFYWGSMYIGYAISSGILLVTAFIAIIGFEMSEMKTLGLVACVGIILIPLVSRYSRALWLAMFVKRDHSYDEKK
jgi:uncharacterized protein (DUF983 family)